MKGSYYGCKVLLFVLLDDPQPLVEFLAKQLIGSKQAGQV